MLRSPDDPFARWMAALEARHLAELTFSEVSRALRALSSTYVERRQKLAAGAALSGAGKRAAFALFYGPLHHLLLTHIAANVPGAAENVDTLVDLGCGTGASGAAWAAVCRSGSAGARREGGPRVLGIDRHPWVLSEAAATYRAFGIPATVRQGDIASTILQKGRSVDPRRVHAQRARRLRARRLAGAPGRARATGRSHPDRRAARRGSLRAGGTAGATRSRPPAAAQTSGGCAPSCPPSSPSSIARLA